MNKPLESDELRKQFRDTAKLVEKAGKVVEAALGLSAPVACTVEKKRPFTTGPSNGTIKLIQSPPTKRLPRWFRWPLLTRGCLR